MSKPISWRDSAINVIADSLLEYEAQCACLLELPTAIAARKYVNERYPFSQRRYTPYKIWLEELRLIKVFVESRQSACLYLPWRARVDSKGQRLGSRKIVVSGQLTLF